MCACVCVRVCGNGGGGCGGGGDGGGGGGGSSGGVHGISWDDPLLADSSIFVFIEKAIWTE